MGERSDSDMIYSPPSTLCTISPAPHNYGSSAVYVPRLEFDSFDTMPFSASFSNLFEGELEDSRASMANGNMSYDIERLTDLKDIDPEWDDDDIDEIVIMAPKSSGRLPTILEDLSDVDPDLKTNTISGFELLGYSPRAKTKLCRERDTNRLYALKTFSNCAQTDSTERTILSTIDGTLAPFLPQVHWFQEEEEGLHMIVEYYPQASLSMLIARHGALRSDHALFYASEITQGIWALHTADIVHRDLSADNVLIDADGHIVLTGFEHAAKIEQLQGMQGKDHKLTPGGAKENQAPELLLGWAHDFAVDCWGFGILLHLLLSGVHPFKGDNLAVTKEYLLKKIIRDPIALHPFLEPVARDLISKCLERNPVVRLNITASRRHDYFSAVRWEAVTAKQIPVPHPPPCFGAGYRNNVNNAAFLELRKYDHCLERTLSPTLTSVECSQNTRTMSSKQQNFQELPKVSVMSSLSLLDNIPESAQETPLNLELGHSMHNPFICNNPVVEVAAKDRMEQFWKTLDSEQNPIASRNLTDVVLSQSHKLRKAQSSIQLEQRVSTFNTSSLHNKLRKKSRPVSGVPPSDWDQHERTLPGLELPTGVEKIGSGIGFTYTVPAAAQSKASICTNVPTTCHNKLQVRLPVLALGLRLANELCKTMTKTRARLSSARHEDCKPEETSRQDSRWSLVLPIRSLDPSPTLAMSISSSNSSSPLSEPVLLTPDTLDFEEYEVGIKNGLEEDATLEPVSTLRLVSPSVVRCLESF